MSHILFHSRSRGADSRFISDEDIQGALNELGWKHTFSHIF